MKKKIFVFAIIIFIITLFIFTIITYIYKNDNLRFRFEYKLYNYFNFENGKKIITNIDNDINIIYLEKEEIRDTLDNNKTFVLYLGFSYCPWCRNTLPILLETLKDNDIKDLYYINVNNIDNKNIKFIKNKFDEYLEDNKEKENMLYVPDVYFIKNGEVKYHHMGSVKSYKDPFIKINKEQKEELKNIYQQGIDLINKKEGIK